VNQQSRAPAEAERLVPSAPGSRRAALLHAGFAVVVTALAFALTLVFESVLERTLLLFFATAVASSAWYGGLGAGLLATVLSVGAVDYFFVEPLHRIRPHDPGDVLALGVFTAMSVVLSSLGASLRAAKGRAEVRSAEAAALARQLELANRELQGAAAAAEAARRVAEAAERRVTGILESITDGFVAFDGEWRFRYVNASAAALLRALRRSPDALLGRIVWDEFPDLVGTAVETETRRAAADQVTVEYEAGSGPAGPCLQVRVYPSDDGVVVYFHDVTERKRAEASLRESEERFRTLADTVPVMIWLSDAENLGTYFNRPWLEFTGRTLDEELGFGWTTAIHPDDRPRAVEYCEARFAAREPFQMEFRIRRADGEYRWVLDTAAPRFAPGGEFAGYAGSCIDITDRKQAEEFQQYLLDGARLLAASLDFDATLRELTSLLVPRFADYCLVYVTDEGGPPRQAASAHVDPEKAPLLEELGRLYRPDPHNAQSVTARVLQTGRPVLRPAAAYEEALAVVRDPAVLRIYRRLRPASYMVVPLVVRGEVLGAVTLAHSVSGRRYTTRDLALVELLVARGALALDNARLFTETREARDRAIRASLLETQLAQAQLEALRAQLNPHFLFNALNTVAMLVRREANADALSGIVALSDVLRQALNGKAAAEVPLGQELELIERYLEIERLRFRDRLTVKLSVEPAALDARLPTMILQPLVENAVRHGIARRAEGGRVEVVARRDGGALLIEVCDNGPGFPDGWDVDAATGVGLANTRERLRWMYGDGQRLEARNAPDGGAIVSIRIPVRTVGSS